MLMLTSLSREEGPCGAGAQTVEVGAPTHACVQSRERKHEAGFANIGKPENRIQWLLLKVAAAVSAGGTYGNCQL